MVLRGLLNYKENIMIGVGTILYPYHNGFFGSGCYEDLRIEAIGSDWVVARGVNDGLVRMATFEECWAGTMMEWLEKWSIKSDYI
jgi:hypothetical protein